MPRRIFTAAFLCSILCFLSTAALAQRIYSTRPGQPLQRAGDEIVVCGQLIHTSAPVVLWFDYGGYDGYRPPPRAVNALSSTSPATEPTTRASSGFRRGRGYGGG